LRAEGETKKYRTTVCPEKESTVHDGHNLNKLSYIFIIFGTIYFNDSFD